ncbi:hypothetical protein [Microbacterium sp. HMWF026]|uniref:hypothetical protein n=1 Tax=Microbacterium sp. HMWF026 TaxID=2056861 RepID=UPI0011B23155|nr:hypothetical protein [Microbacterium sp. HMWF026]
MNNERSQKRSGDPRKRCEQEWQREVDLAGTSVGSTFAEAWSPHLTTDEQVSLFVEVNFLAEALHDSLDGEHFILGMGWTRSELIVDLECEDGQLKRVGVELPESSQLKRALNLTTVQNHLLNPLIDVIHFMLVSLTGDPQNVRNFRRRGGNTRMLNHLPSAQELQGEAA